MNMRTILFVSLLVITGCYYPIRIEQRFAPRLDDYKTSDYRAAAQGNSVFFDKTLFGPVSLVTTLSGTRPELVLTSETHQIAVKATGKSSHLLGAGLCFLLPFPIIPYKDYNGKDIVSYNSENLRIDGRIISFTGRPFKLSEVTGRLGQHEELLKVSSTVYEEDSPHTADTSVLRQWKLRFNVIFPTTPRDVETIELTVKITEDDNQEITFPTIHLYASRGVIWELCN